MLRANLRKFNKKMFKIDFNKTYRLNSAFYYSSKGDTIQVVNIADDDNFYFKIDGVAKDVFEMLVKKTKPADILASLTAKPENPSKKEVEDFLLLYISDLLEMGILEE